jgi:hypothetical protein
LENKFSGEMTSQGVEGHQYSPGHRGRKADGLWLLHDEPVIRPLYEQIRRLTRLNPALGEDFLVGRRFLNFVLRFYFF